MDDFNLVSRRALEWILALRGWQLRHDGKLPEDLMNPEVQEELGPLPNDPFSGQSFGYVLSNGQAVRPIGMLDSGTDRVPLSPSVGERLIYSVGPDRADDKALKSLFSYFTRGEGTGDIIFRLNQKLDHETGSPAEKAKEPALPMLEGGALPGFLQEIK